MIKLRRIKTGEFKIQDSISLYKFLQLDFLDMQDKIISIEDLYKDSKKINLSEYDYEKLLNGVKIKTEINQGICRIYQDLRYKGLGKVEDNCRFANI